MRFITATVALILLTALLNVTAWAQPGPQCVAVITGIKGSVQIKKEGKQEFTGTLWGTQLFSGDQIKTGTESEVTLTFSDNSIIMVGSSSTIMIPDNRNPVVEAGGKIKKVTSAMAVNMSSLTSKREGKRDVGALAGLRGNGSAEAIMLSTPCNTVIKTGYPAFEWNSGDKFDTFIVNLYSSKGLVWTRKVTGNRLQIPLTEKGLNFGEDYFWNVEGEGLIENVKSANQKFSVISAGKYKEAADQEALIRKTFHESSDSSSMHAFLGAYFINQGLLEDAISEFLEISRMNPDAPLPHEILGSLYSDTGNKDRAIEELQRALTLSKNK